MYKLLTQKGQMFALLLGLLLIAIFFGSVLSGLGNAGYEVSTDLNAIMKSNPDVDFGFFNSGIYISEILIVLCLMAWMLFAVYHVISSPKQSIKSVIAIVVLLLLFFVLYSMSASETTGTTFALIQKFDVSETASRLITAGIHLTGLLGVTSVVVIIFAEIRNLFK